jgi:hypothetical protein
MFARAPHAIAACCAAMRCHAILRHWPLFSILPPRHYAIFRYYFQITAIFFFAIADFAADADIDYFATFVFFQTLPGHFRFSLRFHAIIFFLSPG